MISEIILSACICGLLFCINMLLRNRQTFKERMKVHGAIFKKDKNDNFINSSTITSLLRKEEAIASYDKIVWSFWKSPKSFYKEFLKELEQQNQEREAEIE